MCYKIEFTKKASREFICLPLKIKKAIRETIDFFSESPFNKGIDIKKLKTPFEGYRVRKGDYRILLIIEKKTITIYSIKHRKDAYRHK